MAKLLFRVHRSHLLPAIDAVFEAVDNKATIPILSNILLRPHGKELFLRSTDLALEIGASCELLDEGAGMALTLSGTDLRDIVRKLPESVEIEFSEGALPGQVRIQAGRSRFLLLSLPERDFPSIADKVTGTAFPLDVSLLSAAFSKVLYAVKADEKVRFYLAGVCIHPYAEGDKISVVGCDGYSLAVARIPVSAPVEFKPIIIPVQMVKAINKLMGDAKAPADVTVSDTMIKVECGSISLISKLIDGVYPDYMRIVPQSLDKEAIATVEGFRAAIGRVCLVADDLSKETVRLHLQEGSINLKLATQQGEEADEDLPVEYGGDSFEIGFNGKFLTNMLSSIATQDVILQFGDVETPGYFKPTIESDEFYILMPKRL
ncbi:DNA polymerase III subunit beta [Rhizobium anhuiense]